MITRPRAVFATTSVVLVVLVDVVATMLVQHDTQILFVLCSVAAAAAAIHTAARDVAALPWVVLFSLPPVIALLTDDSPTWLIGPLGALLFAACELNVLSWEFQGVAPDDALARRRAASITQLSALGLAAALVVSLAALAPSPGGTTAVVVAAIALAGVARVTFARRP